MVIEESPTVVIDIEKSAPIVLSGAFERRRGYLSNTVVSMSQLTVTATLAIWGFSVRWEAAFQQSPDWKRVAIQVAWAGALSSIIIGLWRFYAHYLDHAIIGLYPALYLCERALLPTEVCTLKQPANVTQITKKNIIDGLDYTEVKDKDFGGRGHPFIDGISIFAIILFGFASVKLGLSSGLITFTGTSGVHTLGWLLGANFFGLCFIIGGYLWWRWRKHLWPVPKKETKSNDSATGESA